MDTAAIAKGTLRGSYVPLAKDLISPLPPLSPAGAVGRPLVGLPAQSKMQTIGPRRGGWSDRVKDAGGPAGRSADLPRCMRWSPEVLPNQQDLRLQSRALYGSPKPSVERHKASVPTRREGGKVKICQLLMAKQPTPQLIVEGGAQRQVV